MAHSFRFGSTGAASTAKTGGACDAADSGAGIWYDYRRLQPAAACLALNRHARYSPSRSSRGRATWNACCLGQRTRTERLQWDAHVVTAPREP